MSFNTATLTLFRGILVNDDNTVHDYDDRIYAATIKHGYLLDPRIHATDELITTINTVIGLSAQQANQAFHKSWRFIEDTALERLVAQQVNHYFTTYGLENLGIYQQDLVYFPNEILDIPELDSDIPLIVIHAMSRDELLSKTIDLAAGIALSADTLTHLMTVICELCPSSAKDLLERIGNRELKSRLRDHYGLVPTLPVEFLRFVVYQLTGHSLLIKNDQLIEKIKQADKAVLDTLILQAPEDLASIFLRYKPLLLAMKSVSDNKNFFNRLRKQARIQHQPLPKDYLNGITYDIKQQKLNLPTLAQKLAQASIYRKIRLANALNYRLKHNRSIVYRVRNGRGWATDFDWDRAYDDLTLQALELTVASIAHDLRDNVAGKTFFIPPQVHYALPATEKQFTGDFPTGSSIAIDHDLVVGIHWSNVEQNRVDLDLSLLNIDGEKIGWDARYYNDNKDLLFSGDVTDAPLPNGASELFYIKQGVTNTQALTLNYYNFSKAYPVTCTVFVGQESVNEYELHHNYMVNPNNILMKTKFTIDSPQNLLGLITSQGQQSRIYFANISLGTSITATHNEYTKHAQHYLIQTTTQTLMLSDILQRAGATIVHQLPDRLSARATLNYVDNPVKDSDRGRIVDKIGRLTRTVTHKLGLSSDSNIEPTVISSDTQAAVEDIIDLSPENINKHTFIKLLTIKN